MLSGDDKQEAQSLESSAVVHHAQPQPKTEWPVRIKDELTTTTAHLLGLKKLELLLLLIIIESSDKDDDDDGP